MKLVVMLLAIVALVGCTRTMDVAMMSGTSGEIIRGELKGDGNGSGTMMVSFKGQQCKGPASRIASDEKTIVGNSLTTSNGQSIGTLSATTISGDATVKALLSCPDGSGIRCVLKGRNLNGGGECRTDDGQIFEVVVSRKSN